MLKVYQLQYNRRSGLSKPDWQPMPEGRGAVCGSRKEAMQHKRDYIAACKRVFGCVPALEIRIASGRYVI